MHPPGATLMTVEPDTVHSSGVSELNDTASREEADADKMTGSPTMGPAAASGGCPKVIFCGFFPAWTWNERAASGAAA